MNTNQIIGIVIVLILLPLIAYLLSVAVSYMKAKAENIQVSDDEFNAEFSKMAEMYKMEVDKIKEFMGESEEKQMRDDIAIQKAVDLIVSSAVEK